MTSLNVPEKFYQVCRLCLTVVSDTNALPELSVFGYKYQSRHQHQHHQQQQQQSTIDDNNTTSNVISKNVNQKASSDAKGVKEVKGVKLNATNKRSSNRKSINCTDELNTNNGDNAHLNSQHEIIGHADENDDATDADDDDGDVDNDEVCNNNNIEDGSIDDRNHHVSNLLAVTTDNDAAASECDSYSNDDSQHEVLEQIHTFLEISVSFSLVFFFYYFVFFFFYSYQLGICLNEL